MGVLPYHSSSVNVGVFSQRRRRRDGVVERLRRGYPAGRGDESVEIIDAVAFRDAVYLSGTDGVYRLTGGAVERVELVPTGAVTTSRLAAGSGALRSAGQSDLFRTRDGVSWERVDNP